MSSDDARDLTRIDARQLPLVMGILNVTPDSFSDGGQYLDIEAATRHAMAMIADGADIIDVGGESTRPGSTPVDSDEQIRRVVPVIRALRSASPVPISTVPISTVPISTVPISTVPISTVPISIDTTSSRVAAAALDAGATLVNDISAGRDDPALLPLVAARKVPVILMHMQGTPATMQQNPVYSDVVDEVKKFLFDRLSYAKTIGIDPADVVLDPGIGFGKTVEHNLQLLNRLGEFQTLGCLLLVGTSRKGFIGAVTGETGERLSGTAATVAWAVANGAGIVRVHDVAAMAPVVRMIRAIRDCKA